jgi:hypothetical protein
MAGFLYFVPDRKSGLSAKELCEVGLGYALDGSVHQQQLDTNGPGGSGGVVMASAEHCAPSRVRYVPAEQEWIKADGYWIGQWKDEKIGPADLLRRELLDGHFVELADGQKWLCPIARSHGLEGDSIRWYHNRLPRSVAIGSDRKWHRGEVIPRYRRLWQLNLSWWDVRVASVPADSAVGDMITFDFDGLHESAAECLAVNYRLGPDEISLLGLFDSESARKILDALIDMPTLVRLDEELQKKTENTAAGG